MAQLFLLQDELCFIFWERRTNVQYDELVSFPYHSLQEYGKNISIHRVQFLSWDILSLVPVCLKYINGERKREGEREISIFVYRKFPVLPLPVPQIICQVNWTIYIVPFKCSGNNTASPKPRACKKLAIFNFSVVNSDTFYWVSKKESLEFVKYSNWKV